MINFVRVFLAIALLVLLIDFLANLSRVNGLDSPIKNAFALSALRTTTYLSLAMPLIIMLSSLAFSVGLARSSEFVISRASGLSALRSLLSVIVCAFGLGIISVFLFDPAAARMIETYDEKLGALKGDQQQAVSVNDNGYWMRQSTETGHQIIKARSASDQGRVLQDLTVFTYDQDGKVIDRMFAQTAFLNSNEWVLTQGVKWNDTKLLADPSTASESFKILRVPTTITPTQLLEGYPAPETISPWDMNTQIQKVQLSGFSTLKYQSQQMAQYARPFLFVVMMIIGSVFTLQNARLGNLGISVVTSVIFGFSLHFLQNFATTLGRSGEIPLTIATWSPILSAGSVAIALFLHYEDG
jgi:lipopolysaccharide export system permease protein